MEGADILHLLLRRGRVDLHEEAEGPAAGLARELLPSREVAGVQPRLWASAGVTTDGAGVAGGSWPRMPQSIQPPSHVCDPLHQEVIAGVGGPMREGTREGGLTGLPPTLLGKRCLRRPVASSAGSTKPSSHCKQP